MRDAEDALHETKAEPMLAPACVLRAGVPMLLTTGRLVLRDIVDADVDRIVAQFGEHESREHILRSHRDLRHVARVYAGVLAYNRYYEDWTEREHLRLAVCLKDSGVLVGSISLSDAVAGGTAARIGWHYGVEHAGRGYATEAAAELLTYAFDDVGVARVRGDCHAANAGSRNVLRKLGMRAVDSGKLGPWLRGLRYREFQPILRFAIERHEHDARQR